MKNYIPVLERTGRLLADAGAAYGLNLHEYIQNAHDRYEVDGMYKYFAIMFYMPVYPTKSLPVKPTVGRMVMLTLAPEELVPADFLLKRLAKSMYFPRVIELAQKMYTTHSSMQHEAGDLRRIITKAYEDSAEEAVKRRLRPLNKRLVYREMSATSAADDSIFMDTDLALLDLLRDTYGVQKPETRIIWGIQSKYNNRYEKLMLNFYDAEGNVMDVKLDREYDNMEVDEEFTRLITNEVRITRLNALIA